jgi:hypothetical protein
MSTYPFCSACGRSRPPLGHCPQLCVLCTSALSRAHLGSPHWINLFSQHFFVCRIFRKKRNLFSFEINLKSINFTELHCFFKRTQNTRKASAVRTAGKILAAQWPWPMHFIFSKRSILPLAARPYFVLPTQEDGGVHGCCKFQ